MVVEQVETGVGTGARGLVIDLSGVAYLDSQTLNMLLQLRARLDSERRLLVVVAPDWSFAHHLLKLTHLFDRLTVEESVPSAVAAIRGEIERRGS